MPEEQISVLDIGSTYVKAGLAGFEEPSIVAPTILSNDGNQWGRMVANETDIVYPIKKGIMRNINSYSTLLSHIDKALVKPNTEANSYLFSLNTFTPPIYKEIIVQNVFELLQSHSMFVLNTNLFSLYSMGKTSGLVIDFGDQLTSGTAIIEGLVLYDNNKKSCLTGEFLTKKVMEITNINIVTYETTTFETKEKYMSLKHDMLNFSSSEYDKSSNYELPDNEVIRLQHSDRSLADYVFGNKNTSYANDYQESEQFQFFVTSILNYIPIEKRNILYQNILVEGGIKMANSFNSRLQREVLDITPTHANLKLLNNNNHLYNAWAGASLLCSLSQFVNMWVNHAEYKEYGPTIIHRKTY